MEKALDILRFHRKEQGLLAMKADRIKDEDTAEFHWSNVAHMDYAIFILNTENKNKG